MSMSQEHDFEWNDNTLHVTDDGMTEGQAWFGSFGYDGQQYDVTATVTSYNYKRRGQTHTNHVPHVVVTTTDGSIVTEPHAWDSRHAQTAIDNAKSLARDVVEDPARYID